MKSILYYILNKENHWKNQLYIFEHINSSKYFGYNKYNQKLHHTKKFDGKLEQKFCKYFALFLRLWCQIMIYVTIGKISKYCFVFQHDIKHGEAAYSNTSSFYMITASVMKELSISTTLAHEYDFNIILFASFDFKVNQKF